MSPYFQPPLNPSHPYPASHSHGALLHGVWTKDILSQHAMSVQFRCTTLGLFVKSGFKNDAIVPYRTCKNQHSASICTCHRKRLDLFLRYKPDWHMCDLCSALSLWYSNRIKPLCHFTIDRWFRKLLSSKNGQN